jgi:hypothetical protein
MFSVWFSTFSLDSNNEDFRSFGFPGNTRPSGKLNSADRLIAKLDITNKRSNDFQLFFKNLYSQYSTHQ